MVMWKRQLIWINSEADIDTLSFKFTVNQQKTSSFPPPGYERRCFQRLKKNDSWENYSNSLNQVLMNCNWRKSDFQDMLWLQNSILKSCFWSRCKGYKGFLIYDTSSCKRPFISGSWQLSSDLWPFSNMLTFYKFIQSNNESRAFATRRDRNAPLKHSLST